MNAPAKISETKQNSKGVCLKIHGPLQKIDLSTDTVCFSSCCVQVKSEPILCNCLNVTGLSLRTSVIYEI